MAVEGFLDVSVISPRIQGPRGADRGFVAGRSGSGKSFLARRILTSYGISEGWPKEFRGNVFIIDPNDTFDYPSQGKFETVAEIELDPKARVLHYVPRQDQYTGETWNALWKKLYLYRFPLMVYVDETLAMETVFGTRRFEEGNFLTAYLTRGRARGKAAILGAQRPVTIPRNIIGQAEWFYVFDLPLEDDRAYIAGTIGEFSVDGERIRDRNNLRRFEFWFRGPDLTEPVKAQIIK